VIHIGRNPNISYRPKMAALIKFEIL